MRSKVEGGCQGGEGIGCRRREAGRAGYVCPGEENTGVTVYYYLRYLDALQVK